MRIFSFNIRGLGGLANGKYQREVILKEDIY